MRLSNIPEYIKIIPINIIKIKIIELIGGKKSMVKYKVNLKFKDESISLNKIITEVLKIELANMLSVNCNYKDY